MFGLTSGMLVAAVNSGDQETGKDLTASASIVPPIVPGWCTTFELSMLPCVALQCHPAASLRLMPQYLLSQQHLRWHIAFTVMHCWL